MTMRRGHSNSLSIEISLVSTLTDSFQVHGWNIDDMIGNVRYDEIGRYHFNLFTSSGVLLLLIPSWYIINILSQFGTSNVATDLFHLPRDLRDLFSRHHGHVPKPRCAIDH